MYLINYIYLVLISVDIIYNVHAADHCDDLGAVLDCL